MHVVAVDVKKKKIVSLDVTSEQVYDGSKLKEMVDSSSENNTLKRVFADEAYDNNETFQYLSDKSIEAAIKVRKEKLFIWQQINRLSKKDSYCTEAVKEF
ncbi:MAG TPA: transposase [Nitrososphaeraceae archaeon]|nr:transposase [Nitrososphaeraceae archaeon]